MVFAWVNNLFIQQDFPLDVGPHKSMVNGCCKTTCSGGGDVGVSGGGGGGGGDEYAWLLGGYASLLCGYGRVVLWLFLLCLIRASFLENSISHLVHVVDIVETLLNTSNSLNCSDQNDKNVCSVAIYILQWP